MLLIFEDPHTVGITFDFTRSPSISQLLGLVSAAAAEPEGGAGAAAFVPPTGSGTGAGAGAGTDAGDELAIDAAESAQHRGTALTLLAKH